MTKEQMAKDLGFTLPEYEVFLTLTEEQQNSYINNHKLMKRLYANDVNDVIVLHCKPTYNYQSLEFDYVVRANNEEDIEAVKSLYKKAIDMLVELAPEQPDAKGKKPVKKGPPASDRQKRYMDKLGIKYSADITAKEASEVITEVENGIYTDE